MTVATLLKTSPAYQALRTSDGAIHLCPTRLELYQAQIYRHPDRKTRQSDQPSPPSGTGRPRLLTHGRLSPEQEFDHSSDMVSLLIFLSSQGLAASEQAPLLMAPQIDAYIGHPGPAAWRQHVLVPIPIAKLGEHIWGPYGKSGGEYWARQPKRRETCERLFRSLNVSVRRKTGDINGTRNQGLPDPKADAVRFTARKLKGATKLAPVLLLAEVLAGDEVKLTTLTQPYEGDWRAVFETIGRDIEHRLSATKICWSQTPAKPSGEKPSRLPRSTCILPKAWLEVASPRAAWAREALDALERARKQPDILEAVVCLQRRGQGSDRDNVEKARKEILLVLKLRRGDAERRAGTKRYLNERGKRVRFSTFRRHVDKGGVMDIHDWRREI